MTPWRVRVSRSVRFATPNERPVVATRRAEERLPVTEVTFSMAGAASPFGDDLEFPLPVDRLLYEQPPAP